MILSTSKSTLRLATLRRGLSTKTQPCSAYLAVTHPDTKASPSSDVTKTLDRFNAATLATYSRPAVLLTHGKGLDLYARVDSSVEPSGTAERKYLDFSSGISVNSLGHADDQIADIAAEQAHKLVHSSNLYHNEWSGELADRMVTLTREHGGLGLVKGSNSPDQLKVFLANSGTEANEAALKFARKYSMVRSQSKPGDKAGLVSFSNAFHGRTMGALSMTPAPKYQEPFAPLIPHVRTGSYNSTQDLETLIDEKTAGVIVEPIQGEGGVFPATLDFLKALRARCDEVGALLIYDEIQCGLMRSGTLWCHSEMPVEAHPDIVTMAKPLANGFPIGAVLMRQKVADALAVGDHGTTFGGGPLTSRIAHHVLGRLTASELVSNVQSASQHLKQRLSHVREMFQDLIKHDDSAASPRGRGLLIGMSLQNAKHVPLLLKIARERGLILLSAGSDTVRIAPSLIVSAEQIDKACDILESALLVLREESSRL